MTIAKLFKHVHYKVSNETMRFQETSKASEAKYRQLEDQKDALSRLVLYLDVIQTDQYSALDEDLRSRLAMVSKECKRI